MNGREKKFLSVGLGLGLILAVAAFGAVSVVQHYHGGATVASATAASSDADASAGTQSDELATAPGSTVELSPQEQEAAGVQVSAVRRQKFVSALDAFGRVEEPEQQLSTVSARIAGRIDKLYVQFTGQTIQRGQPIARIYSPDLNTSAEEYRLALENRKRLGGADTQAVQQADDLVEASRRRLELWGITSRQIEQLSQGESNLDVTVYSPTSGTITERKVTQGQYVNTGDVLYTLADLNQVWIKADVYESQVPEVRVGQAAVITTDALPNQKVQGRVEFIEPTANAQTRTVAVHVHVANPGMRLRPGMFVRATFASTAADRLVIPRSAVLATGMQKLVYVAKGDDIFEARRVELGPSSDDLYPVLAGLTPGERVATNGNFLIDSQTRLSGGMTGLFGGSKEFGNRDHAGPEKPAGSKEPRAAAKLSFSTDPTPLKGAAANTFHVQLTDAAGKAIADARIKVTVVMPAMPAMNMPEMRATGELGWNGREYEGKVQVPTAGVWNVTVEAVREGQTIASTHERLVAN